MTGEFLHKVLRPAETEVVYIEPLQTAAYTPADTETARDTGETVQAALEDNGKFYANWLTGRHNPNDFSDATQVSLVHNGLTRDFQTHRSMGDVAATYHRKLKQALESHAVCRERGMDPHELDRSRVDAIRAAQNVIRLEVLGRQSALYQISFSRSQQHSHAHDYGVHLS